MVMLNEIGDMSKVDDFMKGKLERKEKIMGFGHRVYKAYDPRATYLKTFAEGLALAAASANGSSVRPMHTWPLDRVRMSE